MVSLDRLAHYLVRLNTQIQIDNNQQDEALGDPQNLLYDDDPVPEAQVRQIMQIRYHEKLVPEPPLRLGQEPNREDVNQGSARQPDREQFNPDFFNAHGRHEYAKSEQIPLNFEESHNI